MPEYLSARLAAARCGVSEKTVRRWIKSGRLTADRDGRDFRVDIGALEAAVAQRRGQAADNGHGAASIADTAVRLSGLADTHAADNAAAVELVRLVEKLQQQNLELAGRVGYLQAELAQARAALEAPKAAETAPEPAPPDEAASRPAAGFWARLAAWFGG
jgi:excisionase family DNA binding protein